MTRPRFLLLFLAFLGAPVVADEPPMPDAPILPAIVCPPKFSVPLFVPVEELLRGLPDPATSVWIIRDKPVADCVHVLADPHTRLHEDYVGPLQTRAYQTQVRLLTAEIASLERRLREYRYFNKAGALFATVEDLELSLLASREKLRNVRYERMLFLRHQARERQLAEAVPVFETVPATSGR